MCPEKKNSLDVQKQTNKQYTVVSREILYALQTKDEVAGLQNCDDSSKLVCPNPCKNNIYFDLFVSLYFYLLIYFDLL